MKNYKYNILNYWNDQDDLYVHYEVEDIENNITSNVIGYYNISDLDCNYNDFNDEEIKKSLYKLLKQHNGYEFNLARVSNLSPLLQYIYDRVCESESNMCHIDYNDWKELKEDYDFLEEDFITLKKEILDHNLENYITLDDNEYKICAYGCLQCQFNDDRNKSLGSDELER